MMKMIQYTVAASLAFSALTHAATIEWRKPQTISDAMSDIETEGELVFAIDIGGEGGSFTGKNGIDVLFDGLKANRSGEGTSLGDFSTRFGDQSVDRKAFGGTDRDYAAIIDRGFYCGKNVRGGAEGFRGNTDSVRFNDLVVGKKYLVQYWAQDANSNPSYVTKLDGKVNLILDVNKSKYVNSGQFVVGAFTADKTYQEITVRGARNGNGNLGAAQLNAIQLRMIE